MEDDSSSVSKFPICEVAGLIFLRQLLENVLEYMSSIDYKKLVIFHAKETRSNGIGRGRGPTPQLPLEREQHLGIVMSKHRVCAIQHLRGSTLCSSDALAAPSG